MRNSWPIFDRNKIGHELGHKNLLQNRFYAIALKTKKPYISTIYKVFVFYALSSPAPPGWKKGLEPSTFGTTIRRSNQLSYIHRVTFCGLSECKCNMFFRSVQNFRLKNLRENASGDKMAVPSARLSRKTCQKTVGTSIDGIEVAKANETYYIKQI